MSSKIFIIFFIFLAVNLILYSNIFVNHDKVPFNSHLYFNSAHHFLKDERAGGGPFNFLRAMGQYDAQWYLKIAKTDYPENPTIVSMEDKSVMDGLTFAFFPLYPLILSFLNIPINNIEATAFVVSNLIMAANFYSLYIVIGRLFSTQTAIKTIFLIFLFPFSIFFRSYFTEGLFLLILTWYSYFLTRRRLLGVALTSSFLFVTRPTGFFLLPLTFWVFAIHLLNKRQTVTRTLLYTALMFIPFGLWSLFNYHSTGNPFYFLDVQQSWFISQSVVDTIRYNMTLLFNFFQLPFHDFHTSRVDIVVFLYSGFLLFCARKFLRKELWWICFTLWLFPLLTHDTISYSRYQSINFPLFVYTAGQLRGAWFVLVSALFFAALLVTSLFFVNWHWIG